MYIADLDCHCLGNCIEKLNGSSQKDVLFACVLRLALDVGFVWSDSFVLSQFYRLAEGDNFSWAILLLSKRDESTHSVLQMQNLGHLY